MHTAPSVRTGEIQTPQLDFEPALKEARNAFYDITFEKGFTALATERGLSPDDTDKPTYWRAVADYAAQQTEAARQHGERVSPVSQLLAATPDFLYAQAALKHAYEGRLSRQRFQELRNRVSTFNNLIREVAQEHRDVQASALTTALVATANISIEDERLRLAAPNMIRPAVRGAQHEVAFGQLLAQTGRTYRGGTTQEDTHGIDYVVSGRRGLEIRIDVKASMHSVVKRGARDDALYAVNRTDGLVTLPSLLTDSELNDRFYAPDQVATERGVMLDNLLRRIETTEHAVALGHVSIGRYASREV